RADPGVAAPARRRHSGRRWHARRAVPDRFGRRLGGRPSAGSVARRRAHRTPTSFTTTRRSPLLSGARVNQTTRYRAETGLAGVRSTAPVPLSWPVATT